MSYFPVGGSGNIKVDGKKIDLGKIEFKQINHEEKTSTSLIWGSVCGTVVVLNDTIHILGGAGTNASKFHATWKRGQQNWHSLPDLPYDHLYGSGVVLNDEIHLLGGNGGRTVHWIWTGSAWRTPSSALPYNFEDGSAVVLNDEIHLLGTYVNGFKNYHYKWDGSSWTSVSTLPYDFSYGSAVVLNNEIHILGGDGGSTKHYKWDGSTWTSVSTLPYSFYMGSAVVFNGEIHIFGGRNNNNNYYKWNGTSWIDCQQLTNSKHARGMAVALNNTYIYLLGGDDANNKNLEIRPIYQLLINS